MWHQTHSLESKGVLSMGRKPSWCSPKSLLRLRGSEHGRKRFALFSVKKVHLAQRPLTSANPIQQTLPQSTLFLVSRVEEHYSPSSC